MRLYILAANYQEFRTWCWAKGMPASHATYVANVERLRGATFTRSQILTLPGAPRHPEHAAIMDHITHVMPPIPQETP